MAELKPCPFCGGKVSIMFNGELLPSGIACHRCKMLTTFYRIKMGKHETIGEVENRMAGVWNRRVKE